MKNISRACFVMTALVLGGSILAPVHAQTAAPDSVQPASDRIDLYRADPGRSGFDPINVALPLSVVWRLSGTARTDSLGSIVAANNTAYYGAGSSVVAVNLNNGFTRWTVPIPDEGMVIGSPCLSGDALYVGAQTGLLYKIDRATGNILWTVKTGGGIKSSPVVAGGIVYVGSNDGVCYAVDAATGSFDWQYTSDAPVVASPCISSGNVVFASSDDGLYSFNPANGHRMWQVQLADDPSKGAPAASGDSLYVGAGQSVYSFSSHGGNLRWKAHFNGQVIAPPAAGTDAVYAATDDDNIYCLSDRGTIRWQKTLGAPVSGGFLLTNGALFCGTTNGAIYAFDPATGNVLWDYVVQPDASANATKAAIDGTPVMVNGYLLVLSSDGALTAFRNNGTDNSSPRVVSTTPSAGTTDPSTGLSFSAQVVDDGTGIDPSSVQFLLDGVSLPSSAYIADKNGITADSQASASLSLADGPHLLKIIATDWRGNNLTRTWGFVADHTLNKAAAPESVVPATIFNAIPDQSPDTPMNPATPNPGAPPPPPPMFRVPSGGGPNVP